MAGHQPKRLTELASASLTEHMKNKALQLLNWIEVCPTSTYEASKTYRELKYFFHGMRLPPVLANEITKQLLTKLGMLTKTYESTRKDYFQQNLLPLVEVFIHPNITFIELGPDYLYESGYDYRKFIGSAILKKVRNLHNLKALSVGPGIYIDLRGVTLAFPAQLEELTLFGGVYFDNGILRSIVQCCQELKSLKVLGLFIGDISVPHLLELNHLETLHLLGMFYNDQDCVALINGISTDTTSNVLSASTLKSFGISLEKESPLHLIVDKLPHLTEIVLNLWDEFDLSCLTQLKNLESLTLDAERRTSDDYKKILPVLRHIQSRL